MDDGVADVDGEAWHGGVCVEEEYCRWVRDGAREPSVRCRYSEGHPFENGAPDVACAGGATAESPFCGGACSNCPRIEPWEYMSEPTCVGVSETRGFGVCAPYSVRCSPGPAVISTLLECTRRLDRLGAPEPRECACMVLAPAMVLELANHGWPVALESCLAYRDAFPGQVRCFDETWTEL